MVLNLKQLGLGALHDEKTVQIDAKLDISAVKLWGEKPFTKPVLVEGVAVNRAGITTIDYTTSFSLVGACSRCLEPVEKSYCLTFTHTVLEQFEDDASENDDYVLAPNGELDLDELVTSDILLELDGVTLCSPDCKGLCPKCGQNMNSSECGCVLKEPDSRFDVLRQLLNDK